MSYGVDGSAGAVVSLDQSGLLLDLVSASGRHHLRQAGIVTDVSMLPSVPLIGPQAGQGLYAISQGRRVHVYLSWDAWQAEMNARLANGNKVVFAIANGRYDAVNLKLIASQLVVRLTE